MPAFFFFLTLLGAVAGSDDAVCKTQQAETCVAAFVAAGCDVDAGPPDVAGMDCEDVPVECAAAACDEAGHHVDWDVVQPLDPSSYDNEGSFPSSMSSSMSSSMPSSFMSSSMPDVDEADKYLSVVTMAMAFDASTVIDEDFKEQHKKSLLSLLPAGAQENAEIKVVYSKMSSTTMELDLAVTPLATLEDKLLKLHCFDAQGKPEEGCDLVVQETKARRALLVRPGRSLAKSSVKVELIKALDSPGTATMSSKLGDVSALAAALDLDESAISVEPPTESILAEVTVEVPSSEVAPGTSLVSSFADAEEVAAAVQQGTNAQVTVTVAAQEEAPVAVMDKEKPATEAPVTSDPQPASAAPATDGPTTAASVSDSTSEAPRTKPSFDRDQGVAFSSGSQLGLRYTQMAATFMCAAAFLQM